MNTREELAECGDYAVSIYGVYRAIRQVAMALALGVSTLDD